MVEAAFAAGESEEGFDEGFLFPVGGEERLGGRPPHVRGGRVAEGDLYQGALSSERRPKLVGCVGHEVPLRLEGGLEAGEEVVEGVTELFEFVVGVVKGQALVQAGRGNPSAPCG